MDTNKVEISDSISVTALETASKPVGTARGRRQFSTAFKREVVEETLTGADSVSVIARRHDLNANLLFRWRREYAHGLLSDSSQSLIPVSVNADCVETQASRTRSRPTVTGQVQINLNNGHEVVVSGQVDAAQLQAVLGTLTAC